MSCCELSGDGVKDACAVSSSVSYEALLLPRTLLPVEIDSRSASTKVGMLGLRGKRAFGLLRRASKAAIISAHASTAGLELSSTIAGHERLRFMAFA